MAKTDEAGQVVFTPEATGHPKTPVAGESESAAETARVMKANENMTDQQLETEGATTAT